MRACLQGQGLFAHRRWDQRSVARRGPRRALGLRSYPDLRDWL